MTTMTKPAEDARMTVPDVPLAVRATLAEARIKLFAWGEPGTGKSRLGLSFPKPLVVDLEKSTELYAGQYEFLVAKPTDRLKPHQLVYALVQQIKKGMYEGQVETLVIDPITDYLDALEAALIEKQAQRGIRLEALTGLNKAKAYSEINEGVRAELDKILALPLHVVFVCRAKNLWGKNSDGKMDVIGRQPDCKDIVPYLADVVLKMEKEGAAVVEKSRLAALPNRINALTFEHIQEAIGTSLKPEPKPTRSKKAPPTDPVEQALAEATPLSEDFEMPPEDAQ